MRHTRPLRDVGPVGRLRIAQAGCLLHVELEFTRRRGNVHLRVIRDRVLLQSGRNTERNMCRAGQADGCARDRHAVLRGCHAGDESRRKL